jgi:alkyl hydroperoxide reductase subunit AhpF
MRGLCYSALSYAPLFIERETMVIGDGELALRSAAELATVAQHVYLTIGPNIVLQSPLGRKLADTKNVTILEDHQVVEVCGNSHAQKVILKTPRDQIAEIHVDGLFVELGLTPNSQMVAGLVDLDEQGRIKVDCFTRTSLPGLFAAGDVTDTYAEQVLIAVGEGAKAALSAYDYLLPYL